MLAIVKQVSCLGSEWMCHETVLLVLRAEHACLIVVHTHLLALLKHVRHRGLAH